MWTYQNRREDFYESFIKEGDHFYEAFKDSDLTAMDTAVSTHGQIRINRHEKYNK